ncbi:hypothetical protein [Streptomyces sp. NPDC003710]
MSPTPRRERRVRREHPRGPPAEPATLDLYATRLPIGPAMVVELTHRVDAGDVQPEPAVATAEPGGPGQAPTYPPLSGRRRRRRPADHGRTADRPVRHPAQAGRAAHGRRPGAPAARRARGPGDAHHPAAPVALRITDADGGNPRFARQPAPGAVHRAAASAPRHYEPHRVLPDGTRRFPGGTCRRAYCAGGLAPEQDESVARFELRAVGELYNVSMPATTTPRW